MRDMHSVPGKITCCENIGKPRNLGHGLEWLCTMIPLWGLRTEPFRTSGTVQRQSAFTGTNGSCVTGTQSSASHSWNGTGIFSGSNQCLPGNEAIQQRILSLAQDVVGRKG